jgi:very-short-patch-repair endonuclease
MEEKIVCKICGYGENEDIQSLQPHLNHKHKLNNKRYLDMFPDAQIYSKEYIDKHHRAVLNRDPAYKVLLSENTKRLYRDPTWVENHNKAMKKAQNTPEAILNHKNGANKFFNNRTEDQIAEKKEIMKESWNNFETRKNRVIGLQKAHRSVNGRKNHSEATKRYCNNMTIGQKEKRNKKLKETWAKPELREKIIDIALNASKLAQTPQAIKNRDEANKRPDVIEKRKLNALNRLLNQPTVSSLNKLFSETLKCNNLEPKEEQIVGNYLVDFMFPEQRVVVEVDGDYWHANPDIYKRYLNNTQKRVVEKDEKEAAYCKDNEWLLLRFWETDINNDIDTCIDKVVEVLNGCRS